MRRLVVLRLSLSASAFLVGASAVGLMGADAAMAHRVAAAALMGFALMVVPLAYRPRPPAPAALAVTIVLALLGAFAFTPVAATAIGADIAPLIGAAALLLAGAQALCLRAPAPARRDATA